MNDEVTPFEKEAIWKAVGRAEDEEAKNNHGDGHWYRFSEEEVKIHGRTFYNGYLCDKFTVKFQGSELSGKPSVSCAFRAYRTVNKIIGVNYQHRWFYERRP